MATPTLFWDVDTQHDFMAPDGPLYAGADRVPETGMLVLDAGFEIVVVGDAVAAVDKAKGVHVATTDEVPADVTAAGGWGRGPQPHRDEPPGEEPSAEGRGPQPHRDEPPGEEP